MCGAGDDDEDDDDDDDLLLISNGNQREDVSSRFPHWFFCVKRESIHLFGGRETD